MLKKLDKYRKKRKIAIDELSEFEKKVKRVGCDQDDLIGQSNIYVQLQGCPK